MRSEINLPAVFKDTVEPPDGAGWRNVHNRLLQKLPGRSKEGVEQEGGVYCFRRCEFELK